MILDEEHHADGTIKRAGQQYYMKPMNCPFHNLIYRSRGRSYRELPLRLFEFGTVYRYEKSGVLHGITRARGFTQDDAHIYCTKEQMPGELDSLLTFVLNLLRDYGLEDFYLELSTRNPEKSVGSDEDWEAATDALRKAALAQNLELVNDEGGAAFYGPKISVQAKDAIGRTWQMSTIQVDFQLPQRFELEYAASDVLYLHQLRDKLQQMIIRENRQIILNECFRFLPTRAILDLQGFGNIDIFSHA
jgi:threonyl-tRNA synthetase